MSPWKKFIIYIRTANIDILAYAPLAASTFILFLWVVITKLILQQSNPQGTTLVLIICSAVSSLSGLVQIIRRETPGIVGRPLLGLAAIVNGLIAMTFFCGMGLFLWYNLFLYSSR